MSGLAQDLRYALRQLRKNPGFSLVVVLTLALGLGANVTVFSIVNGIILRPLPVPQPQQIAVLAAQQQGAPLGMYALSYPELLDFRAQNDAFSDLFAYEVDLEGMSADSKADHFVAAHVTGNYFSALRLKPALGRLFLPGEGEEPGSESLVVIGYSYWQKRFGGSSAVIGKQVLVDGKPATIIGVSPKGFRGTAFALDLDGYLPLSMAAAADPAMWSGRGDRRFNVLGRLKPGLTLSQAQSSISLIVNRLTQQYPATDKGITVSVVSEPLSHPVPLPSNITAIAAGLFLFLAALVLLLAGVNVVSLLLVRATAQEGEMAIRAAMGASGGRLIRQVLSESILLAMLGAAGGIALGTRATQWISDLRLASIVPVTLDFGLDAHVVAYAIAMALCTGAVVGLWPALRVARASLNDTLREGGRSSSAGRRPHRIRGILVAAQVSGSLMLLIIAGLFVRSLQNALQTYLGFQPDHVLNVILDPHEVGYDETRTNNFFQELRDRVRVLPGVQSATIAYSIPMGNYMDATGVTIEGHPAPTGEQPPVVMFNAIDPNYFKTMKIPLLRGRSFADADNTASLHVAIVNQIMAERFWPGENPIGKRFTVGETGDTLWQVVGIAQNGKYGMLAEDPQPYFYLPLTQHFEHMRVLQIRTSVPPETLMLPVQQTVKELEPGLPIFSLRTMADSLSGANGFMIFRTAALLASCIGGMGLVLAVVGVYGVVAFAASQRTREIGIRMALGASRGQILKFALRQGIWTVLVGAGLGLLAAFGLSHGVANLLMGVRATDPLTFVSATVLLIAVALCAGYIPARRAMKLDPMVALRYE
jgi:macrolide transport system ATP-binding/permease protein